MHLLCFWLHVAATVCLFHQRLEDAAAGAYFTWAALHPTVVVSAMKTEDFRSLVNGFLRARCQPGFGIETQEWAEELPLYPLLFPILQT